MTRHIKIVKDEVKKMDLSSLSEYKLRDGADFSEAGIEAYKFYAYISTLVNDTTIIEIGSRFGRSGVALAFNPNNKVKSFDILEQGASQIIRDNLTFSIGDILSPDVKREPGKWDHVDIVMIDVDPHDGIKEREFLSFLEEIKWEGLLILDDILPNWPRIVPGADPEAMNAWWNGLTYDKYDVSDVGHFSGTGVVNIGNKFTVEVC
jgi:predicted O-methyltransferase YrrM